MNTKIIGGVAVLVAVIIAAVVLIRMPAPQKATETATPQKVGVVWQFKDAGTDAATGANKTSVTLVSGSKSYDAGTYLGSCVEIGASGGVDGKGLVAGELSGVQCWFAGGGDEIGVFNENGILVIKHGELGEPQGDGTGAFRGNFSTLLSL